MDRVRRVVTALFTILFCLVLFLPVPVSAANLYFTAINDSVELLTADSMPFWSAGNLYVPYTVFDSNKNSTKMDLGITVSYNSLSKKTVSIYSLHDRILTFDLNTGTCRNELTGENYPYRAIMRNGKPYLPVEIVCSFFGLRWSYNTLPSIPQGYLVRIKNSDAVLDDAKFIDAAGNLLHSRLKEYTQSLSSAESTLPPTPESQDEHQDEEVITPTNIPTYLAIRCESPQYIGAILDILDNMGRPALFFLSPEVIESSGPLVRQILGTGHSIGILAQGSTQAQTHRILARGNQALESLAHTRTTIVYAPSDRHEALEQDGWICWDETVRLSPTAQTGANAYVQQVMGQLDGRNRVTYLTLSGDDAGVRILSPLLGQLANQHFVLGIPLETRL